MHTLKKSLVSFMITMILTGCITVRDDSATPSDDSGETPAIPSCQERAEQDGYAFGTWEVCLASWLNTTGREVGLFGDGFGSETGWQYAVGTGDESQEFEAYSFGIRAFGSGSAFRASFGTVDGDTLALLSWLYLNELPASEYVVEFRECDLETGEIVTKYNLCYGMDENGHAFPGDCSLTYVAPEGCEAHDQNDEEDDGDEDEDDGDEDEDDGNEDTMTVEVVVNSGLGTWELWLLNRNSWSGGWATTPCSTGSSTTQDCDVSASSGDIIQLNGEWNGGSRWLVEAGPSDNISTVEIDGYAYTITTSGTAAGTCVYVSNGSAGYDLYCYVR